MLGFSFSSYMLLVLQRKNLNSENICRLEQRISFPRSNLQTLDVPPFLSLATVRNRTFCQIQTAFVEEKHNKSLVNVQINFREIT